MKDKSPPSVVKKSRAERKKKEATPKSILSDRSPPSDVQALRKSLDEFKKKQVPGHQDTIVSKVKCGVYAFYDFEEQPIYVGQTREGLGTRINRHLTNQRSDAVAMSVLDPFEVYKVKAWPAMEFQNINLKDGKNKELAMKHLDALERTVYDECVKKSTFGAVLNEKDPPKVKPIELPAPIEGTLVSDELKKVREHPDTRIARRALTISRLTKVIEERDIKTGLRRVLDVQAKRLSHLATQRYDALGGASSVEERTGDADKED